MGAPLPGPVRGRLAAAACALVAGLPVAAAAQTTAAGWQFDGTGLLFGEQSRTRIIEPIGRITRLFANGQTLSAQLGLDVMSGASPTGAMPAGRVQTTTTPSGNLETIPPGAVPTSRFKDTRGSLDLEWMKPSFGSRLTTVATAHVSREQDYQSLGASGKLSLDVMNRLTTVTVGGGYNHDSVFPVGGLPVGLTDSSKSGDRRDFKDVTTGLLGLSRVLTRRWMVGVNVSRTSERGYLTEPYKVVSRVDPVTGFTVGSRSERRPDARQRTAVLGSTVYHLARDVVYASYRYYWDDWGVHSHTVDGQYRIELPAGGFLEPHLRWYGQSAAGFFRYGIVDGEPVPAFASSDLRLARTQTATLGLTYGFRPGVVPGDLSVRAEYLRQWGDGHPGGAVGVQRTMDLLPPENIGSVVVGWSVRF